MMQHDDLTSFKFCHFFKTASYANMMNLGACLGSKMCQFKQEQMEENLSVLPVKVLKHR